MSEALRTCTAYLEELSTTVYGSWLLAFQGANPLWSVFVRKAISK